MPKLNEYKKLLNEQLFFEAHEALEEYWFPRRKDKSSDILIIKGFINAAVAFELKKRGRDKNAIKVWQTYKKFSNLIKRDEKELYRLKIFVDNFAKNWLFNNINML